MTPTPTIVIRADNAFSVPLLEQYAIALRREAEETEDANLRHRLHALANDVDTQRELFIEWATKNRRRVILERSITPANPGGEAITQARKRYHERVIAHDRDVAELNRAIRDTENERDRLRAENDRLAARVRQLTPMQFGVARPSIP